MNPNTESNYKNNGLEKTLITEEIISQARAAFMAAREIRDHQTLFVGIGLPCLVAHFSQSILSPSCHLVFESGLMEVSCETQPLSTASANIAKTAKMHGSMLDVFSMLQRGEIDVGLLSAAQIDIHGHLNSSRLTTKSGKTLSLPGSGGAHDITVLANKVIAVMPSDPRRFVNNVDFITSPNNPYGNREGVAGVAMPDAYFSFDTGRPILQKIYSDSDADALNESLNWDSQISNNLEIVNPPEGNLIEKAGIFLKNS